MAELVCVDPARINEFWPHVAPLLEQAVLKAGVTDWSIVERDAMAGRALVWIAWDGSLRAAALTELQKANGKLSCVITACAGHGMSDWLPLIGGIESYARAEGCSAVHIIGRKGWQRELPSYSTKLVVLEKVL